MPEDYQGKQRRYGATSKVNKDLHQELHAIHKEIDELKEIRYQIGVMVVQIVAIILAVIGVISGVIIALASQWEFSGELKVVLVIILLFIALLEIVRVIQWFITTFLKSSQKK